MGDQRLTVTPLSYVWPYVRPAVRATATRAVTLTATRAASLAASLVVAALLGACAGDHPGDAPAAEDGPRIGGVAVFCTAAQPASLNPFVTPDQLAADLRPVLFSTLVRYGQDGDIEPHAATTWSWSEDHTDLTLSLRTDLVWHDGEALTAEDVAWTLRAAADTSYGYWGQADTRTIARVEVVDPATVAVRFSEPAASELEPFVFLPILPRHLLESVPPEAFARAPYHSSPVGSGPFRMVRRAPDGALHFERFDSYPEELGRPYLDRLVLRPIPEPTTLLIELRTGGVDACVTGPSAAREVEAAGRLRALAVEPVGVQALPLDNRRPPFDDSRVRRAFSASLDRAALGAVVSPLARPARVFLPPSSPLFDASTGQPDNDLELAAALLDSAGWGRVGADGIRVNEAGERLRFVMVAPQPYRDILTAAQAQLRRSGFEAELRFLEGGAYIATIRDADSRPPAMALAFYPEKVLFPDPSSQLHSTGGSNLATYHDPRVDSIVDGLRTLTTLEQRRLLFAELQSRIALDVPMVYTLYLPRMMAVGPRLHGVEVDLNGPLAGANRWWLADAR